MTIITWIHDQTPSKFLFVEAISLVPWILTTCSSSAIIDFVLILNVQNQLLHGQYAPVSEFQNPNTPYSLNRAFLSLSDNVKFVKIGLETTKILPGEKDQLLVLSLLTIPSKLLDSFYGKIKDLEAIFKQWKKYNLLNRAFSGILSAF